MSSLPNPRPQQPPPHQPLNIQRRPSTRRTRDANPPKPPSRSSSFSFSNRTSFPSIDFAIHTPRDSTSKSKSRSNSSGNGIHNSIPTTTTTSNHLPEQLSFTCTFCWRPYPSSERHIFHSSTSNGRGSWKKAPRPACPPCYRAIIDLSIYWVCGEVVLRGEECVSLGWCFWHRACYGCLLCGSKRVVRPAGVGVGEFFGDGDAKVENDGGKGENERDRKRGREMEKEKERERKMPGRKRGREIDQVPLCKECLVEVEGKGLGSDEEEREKVAMKKGLERIDRVDGGLTRRRWEMRESEKEKEKGKTWDGGKGGLLPLRRAPVEDRSVTENRDRNETIYVNIFDPVGREAFRPSLMKSIPEWMQSGAREVLDRKTESALAVNSSHDKPREQMTDRTSTILTPRPISQGLSETSSTATAIQTSPHPAASRASTRRQSGAISPRATSPAPSIDAISRPSSALGRRTPNLRTGTSFVSEQPLVVPSMSSNHPKETNKGSAKDSTRDSWLSTDSNVSSTPITSSHNNQPETLSRPSSVRSVATIFERGIASKDQRHTPMNQPLPLLRVLQQPYRPLTPTRLDTSLSSSSPHLQQSNLATRPQKAQTRELGAASLPKPIQILRSGQGGQHSQINRMGSATVSIPVVSTSSEYLERYQPVKASTSFLSSSSPAQGARSSVRSVRAGGPGVGAITRGWEGQLSNNTSSGETERDLFANRASVYSTSQPPSAFLQASYPEAQRSSIRRSVSHSIRREGALDECVRVGVGVGQSSHQAEPYPTANGQATIRRSISHSIRREGAHDQGQSHHFTSQPQSPKPQSPTLPSRSLPYSPPNSPPNGPNGPNGPTAPIPLNFTVQRRLVKRNNSKGGPTIGGSVVTAASTNTTGTEGAASSSKSSPGTGTGEEKGGSSGIRGNGSRTRTPSAGRMMTDTSSTSGAGTPVMPAPVNTLSKRRSVHAELKRLFGRQ